MKETWKPVYNYETYEVSSMGSIRNVTSGIVLKPQKRKHGYLSVWLYAKGGRKQVSIHRIVAEAFCERKNGQDEVNHLNEIKTDNRAENLAWCTRSENCAYGDVLAEKRKAWRNNRRSKAVRQYTLSGDFIKEYPSMHEVRRQTGFAESNVHHAINGRYSQAYGYRWKYAG